MIPIWEQVGMDMVSYSKLPWKAQAVILRRFGHGIAIHGDTCKCFCHPKSLISAYKREAGTRSAIINEYPQTNFGDEFIFEKPRPKSW